MPELPEVETVRTGLEPDLVGKEINQAELRRPDLRIPFPPNFSNRLEGTRILALRRRAKYLLADLDSDETLIIHLGMSGRLTWQARETAEYHHQLPLNAAHDHVVLRFAGDGVLTFNDPRRFGLMTLTPTKSLAEHKLFRHLGPEPLGNSFSGPALHEALKDRRTAIKLALLDQRIVVGVGNIYASEALYEAGISPKRAAGRVSAKRCETLVSAIKDVLNAAIEAGGSSLRDYVHADGSLGYFQHRFKVYDRAGEMCGRKTSGQNVIRRIVQGGRSTFYCPGCQK